MAITLNAFFKTNADFVPVDFRRSFARFLKTPAASHLSRDFCLSPLRRT